MVAPLGLGCSGTTITSLQKNCTRALAAAVTQPSTRPSSPLQMWLLGCVFLKAKHTFFMVAALGSGPPSSYPSSASGPPSPYPSAALVCASASASILASAFPQHKILLRPQIDCSSFSSSFIVCFARKM